MKRFTALTMAALMVFAAFSAVAAADTVEVRGAVVDGNTTWTAANFAGFWYDLDEDLSSETLQLLNHTDLTIEEEAGLVYTAVPRASQTPEYAFTVSSTSPTDYTYSKLGLFATEYFAVDGEADTLSKIIMDVDDSYTMRTGESLELGEGYSLTPQQIDVDGNKVWLELTKDGDFVDDKIISTSGNASQANKTWFYEQDVGDTEDVVTLMVHIDEVFQGQVDSLCVVEGI
ncbi:MAG: S-layer protein, partial [Methanosarcinaceae archaeon]|nr:S-layer protein [Methanosarcinaceae archaeon]